MILSLLVWNIIYFLISWSLFIFFDSVLKVSSCKSCIFLKFIPFYLFSCYWKWNLFLLYILIVSLGFSNHITLGYFHKWRDKRNNLQVTHICGGSRYLQWCLSMDICKIWGSKTLMESLYIGIAKRYHFCI